MTDEIFERQMACIADAERWQVAAGIRYHPSILVARIEAWRSLVERVCTRAYHEAWKRERPEDFPPND